MEKIDTARLNRELPAILERIANGESFMLRHFGRDVAILSPVVTNPSLEPTEHMPSARSTNPLMKKILRKRGE